MLKDIAIKVDEIYVPVKHTKGFDADKAQSLAEDILENGLRVPIQVREGKGRYVLVSGNHRLEAVKALGEATIQDISSPRGRFEDRAGPGVDITAARPLNLS